jgi:hypothetical protein
MATVRAFLEALFSPDLGGAFIEVRLIKPDTKPAPVFYDSAAQLVDAAPKNLAEQSGCNVYFGVCPRSRQAGTKAAITTARCLWADLDAKDFQGGKGEARQRLQEFPFVPSALIDSGHGFHGYWLLKEPEEIAGPASIARLEALLKALAAALGADRQAAELARLLRLPETYNVKDPAAPVVHHFEP